MHEVLVNRLGGLSLPRKSVVRLTDRPDMTLDVYRGRKTTIQQPYFHALLTENCNNHNLLVHLLVLCFQYTLYLQFLLTVVCITVACITVAGKYFGVALICRSLFRLSKLCRSGAELVLLVRHSIPRNSLIRMVNEISTCIPLDF